MRAFREDVPFAIVFAVLAAFALAPLFFVTFVPGPDLPGNVAGATLLARVAIGDSAALLFYRVSWVPTPYWTVYALVGGAALAVGPLLATKLVTGALVLFLPLSVLRLLVALRRSPRLAACAFLLCWDHNLLAGWHTFAFGMCCALVLIAKMLEAGDARAALMATPWALLVALSHPQAMALVGVVALATPFVSSNWRERLGRNAIAMMGMGVVTVGWLIARTSGPAKPFHLDYPAASDKTALFFLHSIDVLPSPSGQLAAALGAMLLVFGTLALTALPRAEVEPFPRRAGLVVVGALLALYAAAPMAIEGPIPHWYTYPRYATYLLVALPFVPTPRLDGWRGLVLAPVALVAIASSVAMISAFRDYEGRTQPFVKIIDAIPAGSRVLPLEYVDADPAFKLVPLQHMHSWITAVKRTYDPHIFEAPTPVRYREGIETPRPSWRGATGVSLAHFARHYDYLLVQGTARDPIGREETPPGLRFTRVVDAGMWRLYAIERL